MKCVLGVGILLLLMMPCYATTDSDPCANSGNAYLRQTCETLKQSSETAKKARDDAYQKEVDKNQEAIRKRITAEKTPPPPPSITLPAWQNALKPPAPAQNQHSVDEGAPSENSATANSNTTTNIAPLPAPGPTEFANPTPITLPGGVSVIPTKPSKNSKSGAIKYY